QPLAVWSIAADYLVSNRYPEIMENLGEVKEGANIDDADGAWQTPTMTALICYNTKDAMSAVRNASQAASRIEAVIELHYFTKIGWITLQFVKNRCSETQGKAIQANMGLHDIPYFNSLLQEGSACRISSFICIPTSNFQQTLDRRFRKYTKFENISDDVVELTLWDEMAHTFAKDVYDQMGRPVIIAVSSCKVYKYEATSSPYKEQKQRGPGIITREHTPLKEKPPILLVEQSLDQEAPFNMVLYSKQLAPPHPVHLPSSPGNLSFESYNIHKAKI
nr:nucleic acid-binding, OB-fold protein [Tanacetum cinerariifolium]